MVPAAKMSGKLSFKILKSDGTESSTYICSVMDYANEMIKKADTDAECKKALPLVKTMLNYGPTLRYISVRTKLILQMPY